MLSVDAPASKEVGDSRLFLAAIVEDSEDAIHTVTLDGTIISWNRGAEILFGYSSPEIIGKSAAMLAPPGRAAEVRQCLNVIRLGSSISAFETVLQAKDGRGIDVSLSISAIRNTDGEVVGAAGIARDIGKRLIVERKIRESEERFRSVFTHAPSGICVTQLDGRFIQVNAAFCQMLGYSEHELLAKTWAQLTHPDDLRSSFGLTDQLSNEPNSCVDVEKRYFHSSGSIVWAHVRISMVRDNSGKPSYFVVHVEDITDRKRAAESLRQSEDRLRIQAHALQSAGECISITDTEDRLLYVNNAFLRTYGYEEHELTGQHVGILRSMRTSKEVQGEILPATMSGQWHGEIWNRTKQGREFPISLSTSVVSDEKGRRIALVGFARDITERKQAELARQFQLSVIRAIHEGSLDGILVVNDEGRVVSLNERFLDLWRIPIPEGPGSRTNRVIGTRDEPLLAAVLGQVKDQESFLLRVRELYDNPEANDQCEIELKDGRTLERYSSGLRGDNDHYMGRAWFFRDITERKQVAEILQSSEEKFRQLAENIHQVFWIRPASGDEILYVSPAYEQIWGRSRASLYRNPMSWLEAVHPEDLAKATESRPTRHQRSESEFRIRTPDGREKWIRNRAFPIRDQEGKLIRVVGIAEEITERKRHEAELIQAWEGANSRSRVLEKINAREPLGDVIGATASFLKLHFPDSECCIHMCVARDYLELVPESCSSPELRKSLGRVSIAGRSEICARAAADSKCTVEREPRLGYSWPVLDSNHQVLATISVFPNRRPLPDSHPRILDLTAQLVALAINSRRLYDGLTHLSRHDSLTGLPNRVFLDEHLVSRIMPSSGSPPGFAVAYIDLDAFKEVNDIYGHMTGDIFLQIAASRFRSVLRDCDLLARIGGDEFIAVLGSVEDRAEAARRGHRLLESLDEPFAISASLRLPCTASIGIALFPDDGSNIDDLTRCADESMYVAKTGGKNRVQACDPIVLQKNQLSAARIRKAIDDHRLHVHYQPIFLAGGELCGFEALVRIEDVSGHLIVPERFIDVAEKSSLIVPLGRTVLRQACLQAADWEKRTHAGLRIAVNVSARQFAHAGFFKEVLALLSEIRLPENLLELEITEAALLKDLNGAIEQIVKLRNQGVRIAIDDFGTGYSTLSLVHCLPLDTIKIDRSFVQDLSWDTAGIHAVKAILSLASGFSLQCIAEGVERADQLQILRALGCPAFQGFGFARPMPAASVDARLNRWLSSVSDISGRLEAPSEPEIARSYALINGSKIA